MTKRIAMIPLLLGSTRVPDKNLLLVDGYPMVFYVVEACKKAGIFDEIFLNSEHEIFGSVAKMLGVQFYRRDPSRGGSACVMQNKSRQCTKDRCQTHDHFIYDFMRSMEPCILALIHTTSPLLKTTTIRKFITEFEAKNYDSFFSVEDRYTETLFGESPLNFSFSEKVPTQTLPPVRMITWAMSAWKSAAFMESYLRDDPREKGPTFCGKIGYFPLSRIEGLDGDTWDEMRLIEASLNYRRQKIEAGAFRFHEGIASIENNLKELIERDGVVKYADEGANVIHSNLDDIRGKMGGPPWLYLVAYTATDQTALICQSKGEGARKHCHVTHDEWWFILEGAFDWCLEDGRVIHSRKNDFVFMPRGTVHKINCVSEEPGLRLACGARDMEHIYVK